MLVSAFWCLSDSVIHRPPSIATNPQHASDAGSGTMVEETDSVAAALTCLSCDGRVVAAGSEDSRVLLWSLVPATASSLASSPVFDDSRPTALYGHRYRCST